MACTHDHSCEDHDCSSSWSIYKHIDLSKVTALNEANPGSVKSVFKAWEERLNSSEVDERGLFSETSAGTMRTFSANSSVDDSWQLTPLTMSSSSSKCQRNSYSGLQSDYSYLQLQSFTDDQKPRQQHDEEQNTVHRFFDEWPPKHRDSSCLDMDDNKSSNSSSVSTTRLSKSIPSSPHDFPIFNSRASNGNEVKCFCS